MSDQPDLDQYLSWNRFGIAFSTRFVLSVSLDFTAEKGDERATLPSPLFVPLHPQHACRRSCRLSHHQIQQFHIIYIGEVGWFTEAGNIENNGKESTVSHSKPSGFLHMMVFSHGRMRNIKYLLPNA